VTEGEWVEEQLEGLAEGSAEAEEKPVKASKPKAAKASADTEEKPKKKAKAKPAE
jgi:hypothetical protein